MDITIKNILTDNIYNDLGFMLENWLIILMKAQERIFEKQEKGGLDIVMVLYDEQASYVTLC